MRDARDIILRPVVSERSTDMLEERKYTFEVALDASKIEIARAVEDIFKVKVESVNTMRVFESPIVGIADPHSYRS